MNENCSERDVGAWQFFCNAHKVPKMYSQASFTEIKSKLLNGDRPSRALSMALMRRQSVLLTGTAGCGKTFCSYALLRESLELGWVRPHEARMVRTVELEQRLHEAMRDYHSVSHIATDLSEYPLLVIDDFGVESSNSMLTRLFYDIIDSRVAYEKQTAISTNLSMQQLEARFGERIFSRLKTFVALEFSPIDQRG